MDTSYNSAYFTNGSRTEKGEELIAIANQTIWDKLRKTPTEHWFLEENREDLELAVWTMQEARATAKEAGLNYICEYLYVRAERIQKDLKTAEDAAYKDIDKILFRFTKDDSRADNLHRLWLEITDGFSIDPWTVKAKSSKDPRDWKGKDVRLHLYDFIELSAKYIRVFGPDYEAGYNINHPLIEAKLSSLVSDARAIVIARNLVDYWSIIGVHYPDKNPSLAEQPQNVPVRENFRKAKFGPPCSQRAYAYAIIKVIGKMPYTTTALALHYGKLAGYSKGRQNYKSFRDELDNVRKDYYTADECYEYEKGLDWLKDKDLPLND